MNANVYRKIPVKDKGPIDVWHTLRCRACGWQYHCSRLADHYNQITGVHEHSEGYCSNSQCNGNVFDYVGLRDRQS